ncbi:KH domain-containing protein [Microgenomates group bacterium]|nr:KH domain-containing protein [Microgenomates group bacterium]
MLNLTKYLVSNLVDHPEAVSVTEDIDESNIHLISITTDPLDMGKVIGKGGKIINAIRELVKVKAIKQGFRVRVMLTDQNQTDSSFPSEPPAILPETE